MYSIIVENDESKWKDSTGVLYHFPKRYLKYLQSGTKVIYYKGKQRKAIYKNSRLSKDPHHFGCASIGDIIHDSSQPKTFFAAIIDYTPFVKPIPISRADKQKYEVISPSRIKNYWRDGVRPISKEIYEDILTAVGIHEDSTKYDILNIPVDTISPSISDSNLLKPKNWQDNNIDGNSSEQLFHSPNAKKIGDIGELIVFRYLKTILSKKEISTLRWLANENITPGYDIEFQNECGNKICIEVKSTAAKSFTQFFLQSTN